LLLFLRVLTCAYLTALVCKLVDRCKEPAYSSLSQDRFLTRAVEDTKRTDKKLQDLYVRRASDKERWVDKAEDLLHAASFLKPEVEKVYRSWKQHLGISDTLSDGEPPETPVIRDGVVEVYFMLLGYAFENLLKGILVRRIAAEARGSGFNKLPKSIKTPQHILPRRGAEHSTSTA
jgi:hypothetical protein